jgi:hypothetical protein
MTRFTQFHFIYCNINSTYIPLQYYNRSIMHTTRQVLIENSQVSYKHVSKPMITR